MAVPGLAPALSIPLTLLVVLVVASSLPEAGARGADGLAPMNDLPPVRSAPGLLKGKQGDVLYLRMQVEGRPVSVAATFHNRRIPFFPLNASEFAALVGIDMAEKVETGELRAEIVYAEGHREKVYRLAVVREQFREQRMKLPKGLVDPDETELRRIAQEREKVKTIFNAFTPDRLWIGPFVVPVEGPTTGAFGSRRILNGQPRNQHSGEDIAAPRGTPVRATNAGIVRMVDHHFFSGLGVIVDHGLGLFTTYFHLDTAKVKEGEQVARGQIIGAVGQSGRATGPHLHWGAWLNGSRVNPFALTRLPIESTP